MCNGFGRKRVGKMGQEKVVNHTIRELRLEKGWTLAEAGKLLGLKSKGLGHLENGRVGLTPERTKKILEAYGFHPHDLVRIKTQIRP
jgi:transcriptional regulator with XRE-family HTH domain